MVLSDLYDMALFIITLVLKYRNYGAKSIVLAPIYLKNSIIENNHIFSLKLKTDNY